MGLKYILTFIIAIIFFAIPYLVGIIQTLIYCSHDNFFETWVTGFFTTLTGLFFIIIFGAIISGAYSIASYIVGCIKENK